MFLSHRCLPFSPSFAHTLSLFASKINKHTLGWGFFFTVLLNWIAQQIEFCVYMCMDTQPLRQVKVFFLNKLFLKIRALVRNLKITTNKWKYLQVRFFFNCIVIKKSQFIYCNLSCISCWIIIALLPLKLLLLYRKGYEWPHHRVGAARTRN